MQDSVRLDGSGLTVADAVRVARWRVPVELDPDALERCRASRRLLDERLAAGEIVYGVNTSFGPMANRIIGAEHLEELQYNLIRSHAAGQGPPLPAEAARAVLLVRLNSLVKGYSGVRVELLERMVEHLNRDIMPLLPEAGSVGASGDLNHLAHVALGIIGEGDALVGPGRSGETGEGEAQQQPMAEAIRSVGLEPFRLAPKEGLALLNGTGAMTGLLLLSHADLERLGEVALLNAAFGLEIFSGYSDAWEEELHQLKGHPGQLAAARRVRALVSGSGNLSSREELERRVREEIDERRGSAGASGSDPGAFSSHETDATVQDVYSIRCVPQVMAPVLESLGAVKESLEREINSVNDNPVIDPERRAIYHGGNFHGQPIAFAADQLAMAASVLANLSERRLNKMLDAKLSGGLPPHLVPGTVGVEMGLMGAQYVATSAAAENRQLAAPASVHSILCNAANQDVVSMGTVAARKARRAVENVGHVVSLESFAALQALWVGRESGREHVGRAAEGRADAGQDAAQHGRASAADQAGVRSGTAGNPDAAQRRERLGAGTSRAWAHLSRYWRPYEGDEPFSAALNRFREALLGEDFLGEVLPSLGK